MKKTIRHITLLITKSMLWCAALCALPGYPIEAQGQSEYRSAANAEGIINAREAMNAGDHISAVGYLNEAISANPGNGYAYFELAGVYRQMGNTQKAKESIDNALKYLPKADDRQIAQAHNRRGNIFADETDYETAVEAYRMAVFAQPDNMGYRIDMAKTLIDLDRYNEAEKELRYILQRDERNVDALNNLGLVCMINDDLDQAHKLLNKAVKISNSQNVESLIYRSNCRQGLGLFVEAVDDLMQALETDPKDKAVLENLADIAGFENNLTAVVARLRKQQSAQPTNYIWSYFIGYVCRAQHQPYEALEWFKAANKIEEHAFVYEAMSECYQDMEDQPNALRLMETAAQKDTSAYYILARGNVYRHFNDYQKAIDEYLKYLDRNPKSAMGNHLIAWCNYGMNYYIRAQAYADKAVALMTLKEPATDRADYLAMQALCFLKKGKAQAATKNFNTIATMRGVNNYQKATALARIGKQQEAMQAASDEFDIKTIHYTSAAVYAICENHAEALGELEMALKLSEVSSYALVSNPDLENIKDSQKFINMVKKALGRKWEELEEQRRMMEKK